MNRWNAGMLAGLVATLVLSALMLMKSALGVMPELDLIAMMAGMLGSGAGTAWLMHFAIGMFGYGLSFAALAGKLPGGSAVARGATLGAIGWLLMMVMVMPIAGAGLFGMQLGLMAPVMTLALHLIFGAILGWTYTRLHRVAPEREHRGEMSRAR